MSFRIFTFLKHLSVFFVLMTMFSCQQNKKNFLDSVDVYIPDEDIALSKVMNADVFNLKADGFFDYGYFHTDVWLKFPVQIKESSTYTVEFYQHYIEEVQLFVVKDNQAVFTSNPTGTKYYKQNDYTQVSDINTPRFKFNLPKGNYTGFIKIHSPYSPIRGAVKYWSEKTYQPQSKYYTQKQSFWNVAFGFTVFTIFIAILFCFFTKEIVYVLYALYMFVAIVNMYLTRGFTEGVLDKLLFLRYDLRSYLNITYIVATLAYFFYLIPLKYRNRWTSIIIKYTGIYIVVFAMVGSFLPVNIKSWHFIIVSLKPAMLITVFVGFFHLWSAYKKGYRIAKLYVVAYATLFITIVVHLLQILKMIKWTVDVSIVIWETSLFLELLLFTFAFAYLYHKNQKEKLELTESINKEQKQYIKHYQIAQEKERIKIAKELHDGVVQQIGSNILRIRNSDTDEVHHIKNDVVDSLEDVNEYLRNLSHSMIPKSLTELGLKSAIEDLINQSFLDTIIEVEYDFYYLDHRLPETIEHNLFRITQELIQNIIKHSKAEKVSFLIIKNSNDIVLRVEDDGVGFVYTEEGKGIGLENIKNRINILNGHLDIDSQLGKGTTITVKIVLKR